jgi:serine phosphatase RsbU (regulator of sigma subunit)
MDEVVKAVKAERGFVALLEDNGELGFRSARGIDRNTIDHPEFEISRSVIEEVANRGEGMLISDAQKDTRFRDRSSVLDLNLHSILCTPLLLKDTIIGVIYIDNRVTAGIFTQKDLELLNAIASSAAIAIENARLYEVAVEKGRMERELQMAYKVQSGLIPENLPNIPGWDFAACWHPARQVSGDFYDFLPTNDGCLRFVIADVTDKGMPAALFMALSRSLVRASMDGEDTLAEGITRANRLICEDSTISMPVTLFAGQICVNDGNLVYVNAGHNPPVVYKAKEKQFINLPRTGIFMGFDEEADFEQKPVSLSRGDFIVCYTDGVLDVVNAQDEPYEMERFQRVIEDNLDASACEFVEAVEASIKAFTGETDLYDDLTILVIRRK